MGKEKSVKTSSGQPIYIDPSLGSKLSVTEAKTVRYHQEGRKKIYTYLPDGAEDLDANRRITMKDSTYRSNQLVDSITGKILTQQELNSLIAIEKNKVFSYVPEGKTDTVENRAQAVNNSTYRCHKFVNAITGKHLSKNEQATLVLTTLYNTYSFIPDGQEAIEETRLYAVKYSTYKNRKPVNAVTGKTLSENERTTLTLVAGVSNTYSYVPDGETDTLRSRHIAVSKQYYQSYLPLDALTGKSLTTHERMNITYDIETVSHSYLPDGKEDLPANRCIVFDKQTYETVLNQKIFSQNGYKIQKLTNIPQAVLVVFCDEQWKEASRHFNAFFMNQINRKWHYKNNKVKSEKPEFELVEVDGLFHIVLHNPTSVMNLNINFPPTNEWLPAPNEDHSEIETENTAEANYQEFYPYEELPIFDETVMDNFINPAESAHGFFNDSRDKELKIHERSWPSGEEPAKRMKIADSQNGLTG
ncbi:MAG: hypothetical protein Q8M03_15760 [Legionella sp.]|nr:hypothetical protein [Legionella sp.]